MKTLYTLFIISLAFVLGDQMALAGELTIPNTFTSGTEARAAEVNANFTAVETEVDDNDSRITVLENPTEGIISIHPTGFTSTSCNYVISFAYFHFTAGTSCYAYAAVSLPHNATLTSATCYFIDNSTSHAISNWRLYSHINISASSALTVAKVSPVTSQVFSSIAAVTSEGIISSYTVDNSTNNYIFRIYLSSASSLDSDAKILGCQVNYTN